MPRADPIGVPLLLILCSIGFAVSLYVLAQEELGRGGRRGSVWLSAEIGGGGGLLFWLVLRLLGFGVGASVFALGQAVVRAVIWAVVAWPLTAWRLERGGGIAPHRSHDVTTRICGVSLLFFFIIASAATIISYL